MESDSMPISTFPKRRIPPKLFSDFNTPQVAAVTALVIFIVLVAFMTMPEEHFSGIAADVPRVLHPVLMPGASRRDAIKITITREGKIWVGFDPLYDPADLSRKIEDVLRDPDAEHKAYIKADARAPWGGVKLVLQGVHDAGIVRVAFLADERHLH